MTRFEYKICLISVIMVPVRRNRWIAVIFISLLVNFEPSNSHLRLMDENKNNRLNGRRFHKEQKNEKIGMGEKEREREQ